MKTTTRLWRCIEALTLQAGVSADWRLALGNEFAIASPFLRPTAEQALEFPCIHRFPCGFRHRVVLHSPQQIVAVCDETDCPPIRLQPTDILVLELNRQKLGAAVAAALRFKPPARKGFDGIIRAEGIGTEGPLESPAYLMVASEPDELARRVTALLREQAAAFLLLTPTARMVSLDLEAALARHGCLHLALEDHLGWGPEGRLVAGSSFEALRTEFARRLTEGRGLIKTFERLDQNLQAVAKRDYDLTRENDELRRRIANGLFAFAARVGPEDFQVFATIMALGNRNAAARFLQVPIRTLYDQVQNWATRGKEYQLMLDWTECRKAISRRARLRLEDSVQSGEPNDQPENPATVREVLTALRTAQNRDYPAILAQILDALEAQNARNWPAVRKELLEMLQEEVPP